jgi:Mg-chelatase subunit ChlD
MKPPKKGRALARRTATPAKPGRTIIAYALDESGSMGACQDAVLSGFAEYLATLRRTPEADKAAFFLVKFNTTVLPVHRGVSLAEVPDLTPATYQPNGNTALYDAVMEVITAVDRRLAPEDRVLVIVHTDGQENSSRRYRKADVVQAIRAREARGNWTFVYLGADQDAWAEGVGLGMAGQNTSAYASTPVGTRATYRRMARSTATWMASEASRSDRFWQADRS